MPKRSGYEGFLEDERKNQHDEHVKMLEERLKDYPFVFDHVLYNYNYKGRDIYGEVDLLAKKDNYILVFEYKCSSRQGKAKRQLRKAYNYYHSRSPDSRIFLFYVHGEDNKVKWMQYRHL